MCCWGLCKDNKIQNLPFPQNKILRVRYTQQDGESRTVHSDKAYFIPVLNHPLSSNRYYVIRATGKYKGRSSWCQSLSSRDFPISHRHSTSIVVGKWYIPFMFIKEVGTRSKDQMKKSMFYEMYLEQMWDKIHMCENHGTEQNAVAVNTTVRRETAKVTGQEAATRVVDGMMWLSGPPSVGLSMAVVNRMKWDGKERDLKVERVEEFGGVNGWRKFGCYMLVERFVLRRMDGGLVLTYDFNHTHLIQSKWE
ncbi:uncharacterized protein LOC131217340 [Magnolia sinica]|uniref:uncharacterized protein LOC131217340 n=1 Tax=Magnolia sinica TaxID=86752 RepID=UPI0026581546|nr:uncharacterized protein LOC131217340 [Magnolia sinica]